MAQIQSGQIINAANLINAFYYDAISSGGAQGNGTTKSYSANSTINFADSIVWGPASGSLPANYPDSDPAWAAEFGGPGRAGASTGNAWAAGNVSTSNFKKTYPSDPDANYVVFASHYSGNGLPTSTAVLYQSAKNFLQINWCTATKNVLGDPDSPYVYGPYKASFSTNQYSTNFTNPTTPRGWADDNLPGSVANATYGNNSSTSNPTNQNNWGINNYFDSLKKSFNNRPITDVTITVCHVSCHSSCHGSRGRR